MRFNTEINRAVRHFERRSNAAREIISMHKRHGEVVSRVLEQQLRANAAEFVDGTLVPTSLLAMVGTRKHLHLSANNQALATATEKWKLRRKSRTLSFRSILCCCNLESGGVSPESS